jgi:hypothetical protein
MNAEDGIILPSILLENTFSSLCSLFLAKASRSGMIVPSRGNCDESQLQSFSYQM